MTLSQAIDSSLLFALVATASGCSSFTLLLMLLLLLCCIPSCLSVGSRQQHNVWFNGLMITGIAVDESSGDVYFSDATGNRVVHQSANGTVVTVYQSSFFSPMQLAYDKGNLYVADSTNNRVAVIDVQSRQVSFSSSPPHLSSCSALAVNNVSGSVFTLDGWGLGCDVWSPVSQQWTQFVDLSSVRAGYAAPIYLASATVHQFDEDDITVWLTDPTQAQFYYIDYIDYGEAWQDSTLPEIGRTAVQYYQSNNTATELYFLSQTGADEANADRAG